jgi:hypothetical protein
MLPIEYVIADYLANYSALKAIHKGQVCQGVADQSWKGSWQTVFLISDPPDMKRLGAPTPQLQINSISNDYGKASRMAEITYEALDGFAGELNGVTIEQIIFQDTYLDYEADTKLHNAQSDYIVVYHVD